MGQMGKLPWQCTTTGLDNSIELRMEKIRQAVTEIWVPQVWQPPARPPTRPPPARTVTTIPLQPEGLRGKKQNVLSKNVSSVKCPLHSGLNLVLVLMFKAYKIHHYLLICSCELNIYIYIYIYGWGRAGVGISTIHNELSIVQEAGDPSWTH